MEELTKFVSGQFEKKLNEKSFKDILRTEDGKQLIVLFEFYVYKLKLFIWKSDNDTFNDVRSISNYLID